MEKQESEGVSNDGYDCRKMDIVETKRLTVDKMETAVTRLPH